MKTFHFKSGNLQSLKEFLNDLIKDGYDILNYQFTTSIYKELESHHLLVQCNLNI